MKQSSLFNLTPVLCTAPIAALAAIVLLSAVPVSAALVTATHGQMIFDRSTSLPLFDPSLGALERVQMGFQFDVPVTLTFSNRSTTARTVSLANHTLRATVALSPSIRGFPTVLIPQEHVLSESYTIPAGTPDRQACVFNTCFTIPGSPGTRPADTNTYSFGASLDSRQRFIDIVGVGRIPDPNSPPGFSVGSFIWTGTGSTLFGVTADGNIMNPSIPFSPFPSIFTTIGRANNGSASVTYTYEAAAVVAPVPVPSALLLMGTGLIGLIGWRSWSTKTA